MKKSIVDIPVRHIHQSLSNFQTSIEFGVRQLTDLFKFQSINEPTHRHDFYYLLFLSNGQGKHTIDFMDYPVVENALYFLKPGQTHALFLENNASGFILMFSRAFYLSDSQDIGKHLFLNTNLPVFMPLLYNDAQSIHHFLSEIDTECKKNMPETKTLLRAYLDILLSKIIRINNCKTEEAPNVGLLGRVNQLQHLIDENYLAHKKVDFYAKSLLLSEKQLNILSKKALGKTISQLIDERLILEAKRLIVCTDLHIMEIAYHLGFEDHSYFNRHFKNRTSVTPLEFRQSGGKIL